MQPEAEFVHWLFATGFLVLGICLLAESIVGPEVWGRNPWRPYLWPGAMFVMALRRRRSSQIGSASRPPCSGLEASRCWRSASGRSPGS